MLLNISNHPQKSWSEDQIKISKKNYGKIIDIKFPNINPEDNLTEINALANEYFYQVKFLINKHSKENNAVHLMGEMTFVHRLLLLLAKEGIHAVASTTERMVVTESEGRIVKRFRFVRYRKYF